MNEPQPQKIEWKGSTLLAPVPPVLVSCGTREQPNLLTVAWTGILNSQPPKTYISLRPERYSYDLVQKSSEFVLNLPTETLLHAVDWCGVKSGRDHQKFEEMHLTAQPIPGFSCPMLAESPVSLACRVFQITPLGSHDMFLANIESVFVSPTLLDDTGKLHLERAGLCAYAHGAYFALGRQLGTFGYSVQKKKKFFAER